MVYMHTVYYIVHIVSIFYASATYDFVSEVKSMFCCRCCCKSEKTGWTCYIYCRPLYCKRNRWPSLFLYLYSRFLPPNILLELG